MLPLGGERQSWPVRGGFDMPKSFVVLFVSALLMTSALAAVAMEKPAPKPQTMCPVSGEPIDTSVHVDYQGQRIHFCCPKCPPAFRKDPETYFAKFEKEGVQLENIQTTCPVSGEKLGEGDMGEPVTISYKGRTVKFCCNRCVKKFEADPAKYLAKLPGEQPATK